VSISIMKIITFVIAATTVLVAYRRVTLQRLEQLEVWLATLVLVVAVFSLLTLVRPSIAIYRTGTGLQGVLGHPQALAVLLAPLAAWLLSALTLIKGRLKPLLVLLIGALCVAMLMTEARTAAVAVAIGLALAALRALRTSRTQPFRASIGRLVAFAVVGVIGIGVASMTTDKLSAAATDFMMKRSGAKDVSQAFYKSRGGGIVSQWHNFLDAPLTGHGFGVYADGHFPAGVAMFQGIPISAPVEKGFVPTAVLEENGFFGGLLFLFAIVRLGQLAWRSGDPRRVALFGACVAVNLGEAVILAPGGIGMFVWILIGLATAPARARASMPVEPAAESMPARAPPSIDAQPALPGPA
jgi:hypothetical protein